MEKTAQILDELSSVISQYDLPTDKLEQLRQSLRTQKVRTPVIGRFSSGKSTLLNTLLGYSRKMLPVDLEPATAVPTELIYTDGEDQAVITYRNGDRAECSLEQYSEAAPRFKPGEVEKVQLALNNSALKNYPDLILVDMPGFDSDNDMHDEALNGYLPESLACLVAFPADDMIFRESMGTVLDNIGLFGKEFAVVITKCDKADGYTVENCQRELQEKLKKYAKGKDIDFILTDAYAGKIDMLKRYLNQLQGQAQRLIDGRYTKQTAALIEEYKKQLMSFKTNVALLESDISSREEALEKKRKNIEPELTRLTGRFDNRLQKCIEEIRADVIEALNAKTDDFVTMLMNKQNIESAVASTAKAAASKSVEEHYGALVQEYMDGASASFDMDAELIIGVNLNSVMETGSAGIVKKAAIAMAGFAIVPLITLVAVVAVLIKRGLKRKEMREQLCAKLHVEIFPNVAEQLVKYVRQELFYQANGLKDMVKTSMSERIAGLDRELADLRNQKNAEDNAKNERLGKLDGDIRRLGEMKDALGA